MRVLLVEDDAPLARSIELKLQAEGLVVHVVGLGRDAIEMAVPADIYHFDLIVLDLSLPDVDGLMVLRKIRDSGVLTPILILTGRDTIDDKLQGLSNADDYLVKPFNLRELVARIHAIIRRSKGHAANVITTGRMTVNLDRRMVEVDGRPLHLTGKEYAIIELLSLRKGTTLAKETFLNHLYNGIDEPELKIVDVFVCKLRKKLQDAVGENYIETVWGRGYTLRAPDSKKPVKGAKPALKVVRESA